MKTIIKAYLASTTAALIWGMFFVIAKSAVTTMPILSTLTWRYGFALFPVAFFSLYRKIQINKQVLWGGVVLGMILFLADFFQLTGIKHGTVSGSALLSQMTILFTPLFLRATGKPVSNFDTLRAITAFLGMILFVTELHLTLNLEDLFIVIFAALLSLYFIVNERMVQRINFLSLFFVQLTTQTILSLGASLLVPNLTIPENTPWNWIAIAYLGIFGTALAWGLNAWSQQFVQPQRVVLVYIIEPLLAGFLGVFFFRESFTPLKLMGAVLIIIAIIAPLIQQELRPSRHR